MSKIHEELPNQSFNRPAGIVSATVCSKSGKLPISGICDATLKTEYFAEGTVPTDSCNIHYSGMVCAYSMLPAADDCPFKVPGTLELNPDDLKNNDTSGDAVDPANDPLQTGTAPGMNENIQKCPHDAAFFLQPNADALIEQQRLEMQLNALQNGITLPETVTDPSAEGSASTADPILTQPITGVTPQ